MAETKESNQYRLCECFTLANTRYFRETGETGAFECTAECPYQNQRKLGIGELFSTTICLPKGLVSKAQDLEFDGHLKELVAQIA